MNEEKNTEIKEVLKLQHEKIKKQLKTVG